jgi:hypothetical protein
MNMENYQITPFLDTDIGKEMGIRSNRIADLYVDEYQRLWVADFPDGSMVVGWWRENGLHGRVSGWSDGDDFYMTWPSHWMPILAAPEEKQ